MQVEREVVDLYRALFMRDKIGEVYEGRVTALLGSGVIVAVADPYVDLLVLFETLGADRYEIADDELSYVGQRSGEVIALGDPMVVEVVDVSLARRTVYGGRVVSAPSGKSARGSRRGKSAGKGGGEKRGGEKRRGQGGPPAQQSPRTRGSGSQPVRGGNEPARQRAPRKPKKRR
jgi:ribonuclease R